MHVPAGGGPPLHRHDFEEMFTLLEGELQFTFRGETSTIRAGSTVNIPANAPHGFKNASDAAVRMLCIGTPAGLDEFSWRSAIVSIADPLHAALDLVRTSEIRRGGQCHCCHANPARPATSRTTPHRRKNFNGARESSLSAAIAARCSGELWPAMRALNTSVPQVGVSSRKLTEVQMKRVSSPTIMSPKGPRTATIPKATPIRPTSTAHAVAFATALVERRMSAG
jgi:hypothetical protein